MYRFVFDSNDSKNVMQLGESHYNLILNHELPCSRLVITNIIIPYTFYNVHSGNNEIIVDGSKLNIPLGNYNSITLLNRFKEMLIEWSKTSPKGIIQPTFLNDMKYDECTMKYHFKISAYSPIDVQFTTSCDLFGVSSDKKITLGVIEKVMPYVCNMMSVPAVYIRSNLRSGFVYNNSTTNILFRLPVDKNPGSLLIYENNNIDQYINVHNINNLDIYLTDNIGNQLNLNGGDFKIEFLLM
jgi:hypothetical protein